MKNIDEATELQEISNVLEKTFKQLNDLKNYEFSRRRIILTYFVFRLLL